jgi:hypothetical protein
VPRLATRDTHRVIVHLRCSGIVGLACAAVLVMAGCGGSDESAYEPVPLSVGTGTAATETNSEGLAFRSDDFSFTLPDGWAELAASSARSYGEVASAASVAPMGTAPSSLVFVLAYDISGQPKESPGGARPWFDWYARTYDAQVTRPVSETALDGGTAWQGSLTWTDDAGNPVEVDVVRANRGDVLYLIQCQAEPADRAAIAAGCAAILKSFRAT